MVVSCDGGVLRPSRLTSKCTSWRNSAMLAAITIAIAAPVTRTVEIQAEAREPEPRSGSRSAKVNSASNASDQAANNRLLAVSSRKPAKPSAPSANAPITSTASTTLACTAMRVASTPRQRAHAQQQREQRDAEKEANVR